MHSCVATDEENLYIDDANEGQRYLLDQLQKRGRKGNIFVGNKPKVESRWFVLDRERLTLTYDKRKPNLKTYDAIASRHRKLIDLRTIRRIAYGSKKSAADSDGWFSLDVVGRVYNIRVNHDVGSAKPLQFWVGTIKRAVHKWFSSSLMDQVVEAGYLERRASEYKTLIKAQRATGVNNPNLLPYSLSGGEWSRCFAHLSLSKLSLCSRWEEVHFDYFGDMEIPLELPIGLADFAIHTPRTVYRFRATLEEAKKWHTGVQNALKEWGMLKCTMYVFILNFTFIFLHLIQRFRT